MDGFDAELYLRLFGERMLLSEESSRPFDSPMVERARALVAVGAIDVDIAQKVVDDYARAAQLRGSGHGVRHRPQRHSHAAPRSHCHSAVSVCCANRAPGRPGSTTTAPASTLPCSRARRPPAGQQLGTIISITPCSKP